MTAVFAPVLARAVRQTGSPVCVGLDPVLERLPERLRRAHDDPAEAIGAFSVGVIEAVAPAAAAIKIQSACYERYGASGYAAMERAAAHARDMGLILIYDAKRGDIGISAQHYAAAAVRLGAHAITASPYLGPETLEPYLDAGLGVFVLVRTSNPGSAPVQTPALASGRGIAQHIARLVAELGADRRDPQTGLSDVGAVVGATQSSEAAALRAIMPDQPFLIPGFGAQGGTPEDVRVMRRPPARGGATDPSASGVLVTASRSVIYPGADDDDAATPGEAWSEPVRRAAGRLACEIAGVVRDA